MGKLLGFGLFVSIAFNVYTYGEMNSAVKALQEDREGGLPFELKIEPPRMSVQMVREMCASHLMQEYGDKEGIHYVLHAVDGVAESNEQLYCQSFGDRLDSKTGVVKAMTHYFEVGSPRRLTYIESDKESFTLAVERLRKPTL